MFSVLEGHGQWAVAVVVREVDFRDASDDSVAAWGAMMGC